MPGGGARAAWVYLCLCAALMRSVTAQGSSMEACPTKEIVDESDVLMCSFSSDKPIEIRRIRVYTETPATFCGGADHRIETNQGIRSLNVDHGTWSVLTYSLPYPRYEAGVIISFRVYNDNDHCNANTRLEVFYDEITGAPETPLPATGVPSTPTPTAVLPRAYAAVVEDTDDIAKTSSVAALAATVGAGAGPALRLAAVSATCKPNFYDPHARYTLMMAPLQLTLLKSVALGALFGNVVLVTAAALLGFCVVQFAKMFGRHIAPVFFEELDAQGLTKFPSCALLVFGLLYQGTTLAAMDLVLTPPPEAPAVGLVSGLAGTTICLVVPYHIVTTVVRSVPYLARVKRDKTQRGAFMIFLLGRFEWVSTNRRPHWIERWSSQVRPYRQDVAWFSVLEFAASFAISAISSVRPSTYVGCAHVKLCCGLVFFIMLVLEAYLWPHLFHRNGMFDVMILGGQTAAMFAFAYGYYMEELDHGSFGVAGSLLLYCMVALLVRVALDIIVWLYVFISGRRRAMQRDEFERAMNLLDQSSSDQHGDPDVTKTGLMSLHELRPQSRQGVGAPPRSDAFDASVRKTPQMSPRGLSVSDRGMSWATTSRLDLEPPRGDTLKLYDSIGLDTPRGRGSTIAATTKPIMSPRSPKAPALFPPSAVGVERRTSRMDILPTLSPTPTPAAEFSFHVSRPQPPTRRAGAVREEPVMLNNGAIIASPHAAAAGGALAPSAINASPRSTAASTPRAMPRANRRRLGEGTPPTPRGGSGISSVSLINPRGGSANGSTSLDVLLRASSGHGFFPPSRSTSTAEV